MLSTDHCCQVLSSLPRETYLDWYKHMFQCPPFFFFFWLFEKGSYYIAQTSLQLKVLLRSLLSAGITGLLY
jgi:hypothetical protein